METVHFKGSPCHTCGDIPAVGVKAPCFNLVTKELGEAGSRDFSGKRIVLNVFPSLDTPVCAAGVRRFNEIAAKVGDVAVLCVSMDLPFAMGRFCVAEGIENVITASAFRSPEFGEDYGLKLVDGPLSGLLTRAVIILDKDRKVVYTDLVDEITDEPDYDGAMRALTGAGLSPE